MIECWQSMEMVLQPCCTAVDLVVVVVIIHHAAHRNRVHNTYNGYINDSLHARAFLARTRMTHAGACVCASYYIMSRCLYFYDKCMADADPVSAVYRIIRTLCAVSVDSAVVGLCVFLIPVYMRVLTLPPGALLQLHCCITVVIVHAAHNERG